MKDEGYITTEVAGASVAEPLQVAARGVDNEAPYFVDLVGQQLSEQFPRLTLDENAVEVHTTR